MIGRSFYIYLLIKYWLVDTYNSLHRVSISQRRRRKCIECACGAAHIMRYYFGICNICFRFTTVHNFADIYNGQTHTHTHEHTKTTFERAEP